MQTSQLRSFLDAARWGSFNKAAHEGNIAVQAFSQRIATLEQELGFPLFERSAKGVRLTRAGEVYAQTAREALRLLEAGARQAREMAGRAGAVVRVGVPWRVFPSLQRLYVDYQRERPGTSVECVTSSHEDVLADLARGLFDVAFLPWVPPLPGGEVTGRCVGRTAFVCVFRPGCRLAALSELSPRDLVGMRVLGGLGREFVGEFAFLNDWPAEVRLERVTMSGEAMVMRCLEDPGQAALFSSDTAPLVCPPLEMRPMRECPPYPVGAYFRTDATPAARDLVEYVAARYEAVVRVS